MSHPNGNISIDFSKTPQMSNFMKLCSPILESCAYFCCLLCNHKKKVQDEVRLIFFSHCKHQDRGYGLAMPTLSTHNHSASHLGKLTALLLELLRVVLTYSN
jgi:hypothetical protein